MTSPNVRKRRPPVSDPVRAAYGKCSRILEALESDTERRRVLDALVLLFSWKEGPPP